MKIRIPIKIIKIPLSMDIIGRYLENFLMYLEQLLMATAVNTKGIASPKEYIISSSIP